MPLVPITTYGAAWNPVTNQGRFFVQVGGAAPAPVPVDNAEEFMILLLMLSKTGVQFDTVTREIEFPFRPVGT